MHTYPPEASRATIYPPQEACEAEMATTYFGTAKNTDFYSIAIYLESGMVLFIPIGSRLHAEMIYEIVGCRVNDFYRKYCTAARKPESTV
jgi:hypothetical protein